MPKNILLKSLYRISRPTTEPTNQVSYYEQYREMQDLSIQSFNANLAGDWELIELDGVFDDIASAFIHTFIQTHKIWKEHAPCNILYADPDVLCVRPVDIRELLPTQMCLPDLSNCGLRYFDRLTPPTQWNTAYDMLKQWDFHNYCYEQTMYQAMHLCFQMPMPDPQAKIVRQYADYNKVFFNVNDFDQSIIHTHASRDPQLCLQQLKYLWDQVQSA